MAQAPKSLEGAQKTHNIDIVSVSSDEPEIVDTGQRSAYNVDSQANDWNRPTLTDLEFRKAAIAQG